jgi:hypothetical protein
MDKIINEFILELLEQVSCDYGVNLKDMKARYFVSRGKHCLLNGSKYESQCFQTLNRLAYNNLPIKAHPPAGSKNEVDIVCTVGETVFGIETKNKGAFEGGSKKLIETERGMGIIEDCIHKYVLGDTTLYDGRIFSKNEIEYFKKDLYIDALPRTISEYYYKKGSQYIQIERLGLYHTGQDILNLGVPLFTCENTRLRIRSTKHRYTDITAALQFDRKKITKSPYSIDGTGDLPPSLKITETDTLNE